MNRALITVLITCATLLAATAADELPKIVKDQVDAVKPALAKAYAEYSKKVSDENNKLIATIQKAMEKATKAGKLDDAVALKAALEKAKSGELLKDFLEPTTEDLLGGSAVKSTDVAVVTYSTEDPVEVLTFNKQIYNNRDYLISEVAKEIQGLNFAQRSFKEPEACTITVVKPGVLYVGVGVPNDGVEFEKQGFIKTDLKIKTATGELTVVKKMVKIGETISLSANATTNSFPIWKAK